LPAFELLLVISLSELKFERVLTTLKFAYGPWRDGLRGLLGRYG